jgi:hypothetical protein
VWNTLLTGDLPSLIQRARARLAMVHAARHAPRRSNSSTRPVEAPRFTPVTRSIADCVIFRPLTSIRRCRLRPGK